MTETLTPQALTFEHIKQWDPTTMKRYMAIPEWRDAIYKTVQAQNLEAVEAAQVQIDTNTPLVEVPAVVPVVEIPLEAAPGTRVRVGEASESVVVPAPPKKIVVEYQIKD